MDWSDVLRVLHTLAKAESVTAFNQEYDNLRLLDESDDEALSESSVPRKPVLQLALPRRSRTASGSASSRTLCRWQRFRRARPTPCA